MVARSHDLLGGKQVGQIDLELVSELQGFLPFDDKNEKDAVLGSRREAAMGVARLDDRLHGAWFVDFKMDYRPLRFLRRVVRLPWYAGLRGVPLFGFLLGLRGPVALISMLSELIHFFGRLHDYLYIQSRVQGSGYARGSELLTASTCWTETQPLSKAWAQPAR
jgi:hypothetical protein